MALALKDMLMYLQLPSWGRRSIFPRPNNYVGYGMLWSTLCSNCRSRMQQAFHGKSSPWWQRQRHRNWVCKSYRTLWYCLNNNKIILKALVHSSSYTCFISATWSSCQSSIFSGWSFCVRVHELLVQKNSSLAHHQSSLYKWKTLPTGWEEMSSLPVLQCWIAGELQVFTNTKNWSRSVCDHNIYQPKGDFIVSQVHSCRSHLS